MYIGGYHGNIKAHKHQTGQICNLKRLQLVLVKVTKGNACLVLPGPIQHEKEYLM